MSRQPTQQGPPEDGPPAWPHAGEEGEEEEYHEEPEEEESGNDSEGGWPTFAGPPPWTADYPEMDGCLGTPWEPHLEDVADDAPNPNAAPSTGAPPASSTVPPTVRRRRRGKNGGKGKAKHGKKGKLGKLTAGKTKTGKTGKVGAGKKGKSHAAADVPAPSTPPELARNVRPRIAAPRMRLHSTAIGPSVAPNAPGPSSVAPVASTAAPAPVPLPAPHLVTLPPGYYQQRGGWKDYS